MAEQELYMFGVVPHPAPESLGEVKLGGAMAPVDVVQNDSFSVLVAPIADAGELQATRKNLLAHQQALEKVLYTHTLLPFSFGTVAENEAQVHRLLDANADQLVEALQQMEGKVEMSLKAIWTDMNAVFAEVVEENPDIKRKKDKLRKGPVTSDEQISIGQMVESALQEKRNSIAQQLVEPLRSICLDVRFNDPVGDSMCLNAAFLIRREDESQLDEQVNALGDAYENRLQFKYVGPLPVYNFIRLDLKGLESS